MKDHGPAAQNFVDVRLGQICASGDFSMLDRLALGQSSEQSHCDALLRPIEARHGIDDPAGQLLDSCLGGHDVLQEMLGTIRQSRLDVSMV